MVRSFQSTISVEGKKQKGKNGLGGKVWRTLIFSTLSLLPLKQISKPHKPKPTHFSISILKLVITHVQSHILNCRQTGYIPVSKMALGERLGIIRFCETPKDKARIMNRLSLNDVAAESYLTILTAQSMLVQNNGKYVVTQKGQGYLSSSDRTRKIKS